MKKYEVSWGLGYDNKHVKYFENFNAMTFFVSCRSAQNWSFLEVYDLEPKGDIALVYSESVCFGWNQEYLDQNNT